MFEANKAIEKIIKDMTDYFEKNSLPKKVIVGISGGKDSSVVAALSVKAFGKENVIGVMMPNGEQKDIKDSVEIIRILDIPFRSVNIASAYKELTDSISLNYVDPIDEVTVFNYDINKVYGYRTNTPARLRMAVLYGMAVVEEAVVLCTSNLSEDNLGWATLFGDSAGSYAPIAKYTVSEVRAMGKELGLPEWVYMKTPDDGMCGSSDEQRISKLLGIENFTYERFDKLLRQQEHDFSNDEVKKLTDWCEKSKFKLDIIRVPTSEAYFKE